jgi:hypothetical protein
MKRYSVEALRGSCSCVSPVTPKSAASLSADTLIAARQNLVLSLTPTHEPLLRIHGIVELAIVVAQPLYECGLNVETKIVVTAVVIRRSAVGTHVREARNA